MMRTVFPDIFSRNCWRFIRTEFSSGSNGRRLHVSSQRLINKRSAPFTDQKQRHDYWYIKEWDPRDVPEPVARKPIGVIGVPFSDGQPRVGTCSGPSSLRDAGILDRIKDIGLQVNDRGDLSFDIIDNDEPMQNLKNPKTVVEATKKIRQAVSSCLRDGNDALILGGDHSMAIGAILGQADVEPDLCVMWIDAHADINTPLTSLTGNIHGMPLSFLIHELQPYLPKLPGFDEFKPCLSAKNLAYIGLRDVDPGERYIIETLGITSYSMQEVDKFGINKVLEKALKAIDPDGNRPIHFSFDVDALDPVLTPSTGTPVPGGLSLRESFYIAEEMAQTGRVSVVQMAEVNPKLGSEDDTEATLSHTLQVVERCYGKQRKGIYPPGYIFPTP